VRLGDTLAEDLFAGEKLDDCMSNPPNGVDWKASEKTVRAEQRRVERGRFGAGLPTVGDGGMLFLLHRACARAPGRRSTGTREHRDAGVCLHSLDAGPGFPQLILHTPWRIYARKPPCGCSSRHGKPASRHSRREAELRCNACSRHDGVPLRRATLPAWDRTAHPLQRDAGVWDAGVWDAGVWDAGVCLAPLDTRQGQVNSLTYLGIVRLAAHGLAVGRAKDEVQLAEVEDSGRVGGGPDQASGDCLPDLGEHVRL
jgi:hypothetical protein